MATEKRLIDANELTDRLNHTTMVAYPNLFPGLLAAVEIVDDSPTVDAGEVVLCKECMCCRGVESTENRALECSNPLGLPIITPDTYCAYGERREET